MEKKINKPEMFATLLQIFPSAKSDWEEHLQDSEGEELPYVGVSVFSRSLVKALENGETDSFQKIFSTIEKLIRQGDEEVKGLIIVGFLESLQNIASWRADDYKFFEKWLYAGTYGAWKSIENDWEGKSSLADVIRDEKRK